MNDITITLGAGEPYTDLVRECKRQIVLQTLARHGASVPEAAEALGVHVQNFYRMMRNLGLSLREHPYRRRRGARA